MIEREPVRPQDVAGRRIRGRVVVADDLVARLGGAASFAAPTMRVPSFPLGSATKLAVKAPPSSAVAVDVRAATCSSGSEIVMVTVAPAS